MKTLFYQPAAGIAGDMHLAALLDLGVPLDYVEAQLSKLSLSGEYRLEVRPASKMGISGTSLTVHAKDQHDHRHYSTIRAAIERAGLTTGAQRLALAMFEQIAVAEAKIHGIDIEKVHFHEVGAIDSIVDIVGGAIAIDYLGVDYIICNPVQLGSGTVRCAHGEFPVPAPATQEILSGVPCLYGGVTGESTTPTGAAILKASVDAFAPQSVFMPERFGYGIGRKDFEVPNVLRVVLGTTPDTQRVSGMVQIEANIDDMSAEAFAPLLERLLAQGASDAWCTPIVMKKSRPATQLGVLAHADKRQALIDLLLNESTTIGLRVFDVARHELDREVRSIETSLGTVQIKVVQQPNGRSRFKLEHEDVARIANSIGRDYLSTHRALEYEVQTKLV